jgi:MoaA/NifB/PqqE/SkfB family radical SAM enzyme
MPYPSSAVRSLHLEMTERCNAACPMCARNRSGGPDNPLLEDAELSLEDVAAALPAGFVRQLTSVMLCGNFGDPAVARDTLEVLRLLRAHKPDLAIRFFTNGSVRDPAWWAELGALLRGPRDICRFGIDGLEATHAIHRRRTSFDKVIANARALIDAGGRAGWDFLVFRHNEHEVEAARARAKALGFVQFLPKLSYRFPPGGRFAVFGRDGSFERWIEAASDTALRNSFVAVDEAAKDTPPRLPGLRPRPATPPVPGRIRCKVAAEGSVYLSAQALVFPCCWTASLLRDPNGSADAQEIAALIEEAGGRLAIDARRVPIDAVIDGPFFKALARRWGPGGPGICAKTCGEKDAYRAQFALGAETLVAG